MPVADENVSVRRDYNIGRPIERVGAFLGNAGLTQRHQYLSFRAELEDLLAFSVLVLRVGHPDVAVTVYRHAVRLHEHPCAEAFNELSRRVKFENRWLASVKDPDVTARIRIDRDHRPELHARGKLRPTLGQTVWIALCMHRNCGDDHHRDHQYDTREFDLKWIRHLNAPSLSIRSIC